MLGRFVQRERRLAMIPTWMIEEIERERRRREWHERPQLRIELPVQRDDERPPPKPSTPIVIELA